MVNRVGGSTYIAFRDGICVSADAISPSFAFDMFSDERATMMEHIGYWSMLRLVTPTGTYDAAPA